MKDMFHAMPGSPVTALTSNITDSQTTIPIKQPAKLPPAPNICTIGMGETRETIVYSKKNTTQLEGVVRGIDGGSRNWVKGSEVARYYTSHEHNNIVDNINKLDKKDSAMYLDVQDTRRENFSPIYYYSLGEKVVYEFKLRKTIDNCPVGTTSTYVFIMTVIGWPDSSGGYPVQLAYGKEGMVFRYGTNNDSWSDWIKNATVEQSNSFNAPLKNGHTGTIRYSKNELGHVWLRGSVKLSSAINSGTTIAVMSSKYAPKDRHTVIECYNTSRGRTGGLVLLTNGDLHMRHPGMDDFRQGNGIQFNAIYQSGRQ